MILWPRRTAWVMAAWAAGTACIGAGLYLGEGTALPERWDAAGHLAYKAAFWASAPVRPLADALIAPVGFHRPLAHFVLLAMAAPGVWLAAVWLMGKQWQRVRPTTVETAGGIGLSRRQFLAGGAASGLGAAGVIGGHSVAWAPYQLEVRAYTQAIRGLPRALDGLRIAHLSDTHYGPFVERGYLERVIAAVNAEKPDLILLTGDYVHKTPQAIATGIGLLAGLEARFGRVAVLGNHDHWEGAAACRERFQDIGIPLIDNGRLFLRPDGLRPDPAPEESLCIAGLGDWWEGAPSFEAALDGLPPEMPRLLLSHNPDAAEAVPTGTRVDLMLCGHTHGGQVWLPVIGAPIIPCTYGQKYSGGLIDGPRCPVIVSRGVGMAILPLRFNVPPEIGVITLRA